MIIVDQDTHSLLAAALEKIKNDGKSARCIYLDLKQISKVNDEIKRVLVSAAGRHLPADGLQLFLCSDGDIFLIAPVIQGKNGRDFILEIASFFGVVADERWAKFVDLPLHVNSLLIIVDEKLYAKRKQEEVRKKQEEQLNIQKRRQAILSGAGAVTQDEIKKRREAREKIEVMIIEDDAFSRRLVGNVLEKMYPLTGLGEATYALETYARVAPDVLFLDIDLPDVTGHELLEKIVTLDPGAYVIMLSGNADRQNITQAINKGAKGFVAKPFTKEKLLQYIERCPTLQQA